MTTAAAPAPAVTARAHRRASAARGRVTVNAVMVAMILYFLLPFWWLVVAATKNNDALFSTAALWFHSPASFFDNLRQLFTYNDGEYLRWMGNTAIYAGVSGVGATAVATFAGYAFAKYRFPGRNLLFSSLLGAIMVPATALAIPTYLLLSKVALTNTMWAVILPSLLNPFGVYLVRVYVQESLPDELLEAARVDGAGELRVLFNVALPTLKP
ncbi:carbohydrate ABC transporter permease, partial [Streptomyces griseorubiginosus]|uniref:carbohydrate ABC transporter permease n=1 Tax=Streptomyces griseorubiginosus TaxID=67304 RepID=UPI0027E26C74